MPGLPLTGAHHHDMIQDICEEILVIFSSQNHARQKTNKMVARQQDSKVDEGAKAGPPALSAAQYIPLNILMFRLATNPDLRD
jgi:hypothetical protein